MYSYWILAFSELYSPHQNQFWNIFITPKRKPVSFISLLLPNTPALVLMFVLCCFSCVLTLCNPVDRQAPLSMGLSKQEYWCWLPFLSLGVLPDAGIKPLHCRQILYCLSHLGSPTPGLDSHWSSFCL